MNLKPVSYILLLKVENPALQNAEIAWNMEKKALSEKLLINALSNERKINKAAVNSTTAVITIIFFKVLKTSPNFWELVISLNVN